jgi:hypothetical protein
MCQTSNEKEGLKRCLLPGRCNRMRKLEIENWMKRNFVRQITKTPRKSSLTRKVAAITNRFENRISKLALVNCLLSVSARKGDLLSEISDG